MDVRIEEFRPKTTEEGGRSIGGDWRGMKLRVATCGGLAAVEMTMTPQSESSQTRWGAGK